jgi:hypothetical protein
MQMASCTSASSLLGGQAARQQRRSRTSLPCRAVAAPVQEVLEEGSKSFKGDVPPGLNKYSGQITQPKSQGASQAMLYATGLTEADMSKPQVRRAGVAAEKGDGRGGAACMPCSARGVGWGCDTGGRCTKPILWAGMQQGISRNGGLWFGCWSAAAAAGFACSGQPPLPFPVLPACPDLALPLHVTPASGWHQ